MCNSTPHHDADDPAPRLGIPDTGDLIDPHAPDPDPDEVTDPGDPSYVEPWVPYGEMT
jgi:hypothetical protein